MQSTPKAIDTGEDQPASLSLPFDPSPIAVDPATCQELDFASPEKSLNLL